VCPNSRQRVGDGNEIDFDVHGRNTALRGAEPAPTNLPRSIKPKLRQREREKGACVDGTELIEVPDPSTPSPLSQVLREEQLEVGEQLIRLPGK